MACPAVAATSMPNETQSLRGANHPARIVANKAISGVPPSVVTSATSAASQAGPIGVAGSPGRRNAFRIASSVAKASP
jgi:hypothetical protein